MTNSNIMAVEYQKWIEDIKVRIRQARVKAALSVNKHLIALYWSIGRDIVERQDRKGWGKNIVEKMSKDLHQSFPDMKGLSPRNLWRMRSFYLAYCDQYKKKPQPVAEIPWGHNAVLLEKVKDVSTRMWYAKSTLQHGWSRNVLIHQIETDLAGRQGRAQTNFKTRLPAPQSDFTFLSFETALFCGGRS